MRFFISFLLICLFLFPSWSSAQGLAVIRDTETEMALRSWSSPIFKAAGLSPNQVDLVLVNSSTVNAFVAGGANIFIYAGLLEKADFVDEVIGVIAHETGHISGGHLIATRRAIEKASYQSILSTIVGVGAAVLTGNGGAAGAIANGGSSLATRGFLSHSRAQESSADQAALTYLKRAKISPEGMVTFMKKLEGEELLPASQQSEYMRTHPLTRDRIHAMQHGLDQSPFAHRHASGEDDQRFQIIKAKLIAFRSPQNVPRFYDLRTQTEEARYAHAIMLYRQSKFNDAIQMFDDLIKDHPKNPFYHEMKAQTLRDSGRIDLAEKDYRAALSLLKDPAPLIQIALAHLLIEQNKNLKEAENLLNQALKNNVRDSRVYRLLATIAGKDGQENKARYYLAEEAVTQGRVKEARRLLFLALKGQSLNGATRVKAQDLKIYLDGLPDGDE